MLNNPLVSIVTVCKNAEKSIEKTTSIYKFNMDTPFLIPSYLFFKNKKEREEPFFITQPYVGEGVYVRLR